MGRNAGSVMHEEGSGVVTESPGEDRGVVDPEEVLKVRYANSGTEAVMMAVRAARVFTGREKIVKAAGGYDGMWEQVPVSRDQDPFRAAMPEGVRDLLRMVDYNDVDQLEAAMEAEGGEVAAILLEPVTGTGSLPAPPNTSRQPDAWPTNTGRSSSATRS